MRSRMVPYDRRGNRSLMFGQTAGVSARCRDLIDYKDMDLLEHVCKLCHALCDLRQNPAPPVASQTHKAARAARTTWAIAFSRSSVMCSAITNCNVCCAQNLWARGGEGGGNGWQMESKLAVCRGQAPGQRKTGRRRVRRRRTCCKMARLRLAPALNPVGNRRSAGLSALRAARGRA